MGGESLNSLPAGEDLPPDEVDLSGLMSAEEAAALIEVFASEDGDSEQGEEVDRSLLGTGA